MRLNVFDFIIGNPYNAAADKKYNASFKALKLARVQHNRKAEFKALADMKTASQAMQNTANKTIAKVEKIDRGVSLGFSTVKKSAVVGAGLLALVVLVKVIKK